MEHCKDCCCAQSWESLGITEYTGKSIPEHIKEIRDNITGAVSGIDGVDLLLNEAGYLADSSARHQLAIVRSMLQTRIGK